jgi:isocitrate dehydrogenase (NAD+)
MSSYRVTLIPGDGIGPGVIAAACAVLDASGVSIEWDRHEIGRQALARGASRPVPDATLESIRANKAALKGPVTTGIDGFRSPNIELRRELGLHTQVRPVQTRAGVTTPFENVDLVVARETTEDLYSGLEFGAGTPDAADLIAWMAEHDAPVAPGSGISIKHVSDAAMRRMLSFIADWAVRNDRHRITIVHKAAVMRATDGLFVDVARSIAGDHPELEFEEQAVDLVAMQLVRDPARFDLLVTLNMYGDILSDLAAGLTGGVGFAPGANFSDELAVFEPAHGSVPKYADDDRANPVAAILSGALLARHLGEHEAADRIHRAVAATLADGRVQTRDFSTPGRAAASTTSMTAAIVKRMN